ncbi:MAG: DUF6491 family protein [Steroidobacteraceae bacterium]
MARPLRLIAISLLGAAAAALLGCASSQGATGAKGQTSAALPGTPGCFWLRDFDGSWTVLNDSELIVYVPMHSQPYLIKLFAPVPDLKFDQRLGFQDIEHSGMICDGEMDNLAVPHWEPRRMPIVAVRKLTVPEERSLLVENHIKLPSASHPSKGNHGATH